VRLFVSSERAQLIWCSAILQFKQPPSRPGVFYGRDKEVHRLVEQAMVSNSAPLGIIGPGGIGKTVLALTVLHHQRVVAQFGTERFFVSCEGAMSPDDVLGHFANKLGIQGSEDAPLWPAVLNNVRCRQPVFLILDSFESIWSQSDESLCEASEVFLAQLAVLDELTLMVTMRGSHLPESFAWANIETARLVTLNATAARSTFTDLCCIQPEILNSEPEATALTSLLREIDFMPLAITLLARLDDLPSRLLREWSEYRTEVLEADLQDGTCRELSVEVSIKISLAHLPQEAAGIQQRQLLSVFSQLPAGLFPGVSIQLQATIANINSAAQDLLRHSLVYPGKLGELRMLSPVRHYVSASLPMSNATQSAVDKIYLGLASACPRLERMDFDGPAYDVELPNILCALNSAVDRHGAASASTILNFELYCSHRRHACLQLVQKLLPHLDKHCEQTAHCLMAIASQYDVAGNTRLGLGPLKQAAELFESQGQQAFEAVSRAWLAIFFRKLGQTQDANLCRARANILMRNSSQLSYQARPAPDEDMVAAEQRYKDIREDRLQAGDERTVTLMSDRILEIVSKRGDEAAYTKELELSVELGKQLPSQPRWLAMTQAMLGQQYLAADKVDDAEALVAQACAVLSEDKDLSNLASVTGVLADIRLRQGRVGEAIELNLTVSKLYHESGWLPQAESAKKRAESLGEQITVSE